MDEAEQNLPSEVDASVPDLDKLLHQIRERVQQRRQAGEYPDGLEDDMENHFRRIVSHRAFVPVTTLQSDVDALDSHMSFSRARFPIESGVKGGELVHRAMNKALARQSEAILQQVQEFADAVRRAIQSLAATVQDPASHVHGDVIGHLESVVERLETYERSPIDSEATLRDLRRRVELLEAAQSKPTSAAPFSYDAFAARNESSSMLDDAELFGGLVPVFEVHTQHDASLLEAENDASLGAVVAYGVDAMASQQLTELFSAAYEKIRPGGRIAIHSPNPELLPKPLLENGFSSAEVKRLDQTKDYVVTAIR